MVAKLQLEGQKFHRLTVLWSIGKTLAGKYKYLCVCDCSELNEVVGSDLKSGNVKSCGCLQKEINVGLRTTHGFANHELMATYNSMLYRCTNPKSPNFKRWGGRGISVCSEWSDPITGFTTFLVDMGERPSSEHQLDRRDNDGNYCKDNCRWVTPKQQLRNTSRNSLFNFKGKMITQAEIQELTGIPKSSLYQRLKKKLPVDGVIYA